jgi:hypothetical protein
MPEFDEVSSWESAGMNTLPDYLSEEGWLHVLEKHRIIGFHDEIG